MSQFPGMPAPSIVVRGTKELAVRSKILPSPAAFAVTKLRLRKVGGVWSKVAGKAPGDSGERVKSNQIVVQAKTDADFGGSVIQAVNEGVGTIRQRTEQIAHQYNDRKGSDTLG